MEKSLEAKKSESTICNCVAIGGVHSELYIKRVATVNESGYLVMVKEKLSSNKVEVFDYNKIKGDLRTRSLKVCGTLVARLSGENPAET